MSNMLTSRLAPEKGEGISWIAIRCPIKLCLSAHINPKGVTPTVVGASIHSVSVFFVWGLQQPSVVLQPAAAQCCRGGLLYDTLAEL